MKQEKTTTDWQIKLAALIAIGKEAETKRYSPGRTIVRVISGRKETKCTKPR